MQPFLMLQKYHDASLHPLSLSRACTHFKSENTSLCTTSDEEQLYSLHTHRCTKVFSPRKAAGEIDLIWLFSMNLKRTKKKKKKKRCRTQARGRRLEGLVSPFRDRMRFYSQVLEMRKTKERVLVYGLQVVGREEAVRGRDP